MVRQGHIPASDHLYLDFEGRANLMGRPRLIYALTRMSTRSGFSIARSPMDTGATLTPPISLPPELIGEVALGLQDADFWTLSRALEVSSPRSASSAQNNEIVPLVL